VTNQLQLINIIIIIIIIIINNIILQFYRLQFYEQLWQPIRLTHQDYCIRSLRSYIQLSSNLRPHVHQIDVEFPSSAIIPHRSRLLTIMFSLQALPPTYATSNEAISNLIHFSKVKQISEFYSILLSPPFVSRLFSATPLAKLHRFLICALSFSV